MNKQDNYNVIVIIPAYNCVNTIDRSIKSVLKQSFDAKRIRIIAVDNHSVDGTYEKLIGYAGEADISVYRFGEPRLPTRLLNAACAYLSYVKYKYFTFLPAGDELYPDYIEVCADVMDKYAGLDSKILLCETDLKDKLGKASRQKTIYTESCIFKMREHYKQFLINGTGHRVQCFHSSGSMPTGIFSNLPFLVDYTDWYKKALMAYDMGCIYLKRSLACVSASDYDDKLQDLVIRMYLLKKLEMTTCIMQSNINYEYLAELSSNRGIYRKLSRLALQYASDSVREGELKTANDILLFAEMVDEEIIGTPFYAMLKKSIASERLVEPPGKYRMKERSVRPPEGAIII
jgi:glycosyltransferase involved in cell wall biosynthesis